MTTKSLTALRATNDELRAKLAALKGVKATNAVGMDAEFIGNTIDKAQACVEELPARTSNWLLRAQLAYAEARASRM
jgi:hypothetical protein